MKKGLLRLLFGVFLISLPHLTTAQVYFVKANGTGDGTSWENASGNLQAVLDTAVHNAEIWIAEGTYRPTDCTTCTEEDRDSSFLITKRVSIFGGFPATADCNTLKSDRDWEAYPTILSGDIGVPGDLSDNSYHVVQVENSRISICGVSIVDGNANGAQPANNNGAGIYCTNDGSVRLEHCAFFNNTAVGNGAGFYNDTENESFFEFCTFENNNADKGAGIYNYSELNAPEQDFFSIENCVFKNNNAITEGGAICMAPRMHARIFGSLFQQNSASLGGAIYLEGTGSFSYHPDDPSTPTKVMNCTFINNNASAQGSCIHMLEEGRLDLINSILWTNSFPSVSSSIEFEKDFVLTGVLTDVSDEFGLACCGYILGMPNQNGEVFDWHLDDLKGNNYFGASDPFTDYANGDFTLFPESFAANRGHYKDSFCDDDPYETETFDLENKLDLLGNEREITIVDIGAYEVNVSNPDIPVVYVNATASGLNNGLTWEDAYNSLEDALARARNYKVDEIWIAEGTYQPSSCLLYNCEEEADYRFELFFRNSLLKIYGGFPATGNPGFNERNWDSHPTILSGEIGDPNDLTDNRNLLYAPSFSNESIIDGLIFTRGNDRAISVHKGEVFQNCTFTDNKLGLYLHGAGIDCDGTGILRNCIFSNNEEDIDGFDDYIIKICNSTTSNSGTSNIDEDNDGFFSDVDCDDNDPNVNPCAWEIPYNNMDDDCDPTTLDYIDEDEDGYASDVDCNDRRYYVNPGATEIPNNGIDDDCNPATLDNPDFDGDGFGVEEDCDDNDPAINPCAVEIPYNGVDEDCNPATPDDDLDQDGFLLAEDCDDNDPLIGSSEIPYNGIDDDCNPATLDDDLDQDGFGIAEDCDDTDPTVYSGDLEIPYNGIDDDCNATTLDDDLDQDGFGIAEDCDDTDPLIGSAEIPYNGMDDDCNPATLDDDLDQDGFPGIDDCDDNNPFANPGLIEILYNGIDDDCNPATLDDDLDQDGLGIADDCDDNNPSLPASPMTPCDDGDANTSNDMIQSDNCTCAGEITNPEMPQLDWVLGLSGSIADKVISYDVATDEMGNVYTTGSFTGTVDFNPGAEVFNLTAEGFEDVFISKFDINGHFVWAYSFGSADTNESGKDIEIDALGNVFLLGAFRGEVDFDPGSGVYTLTSEADLNNFILKIDGSGSFIWATKTTSSTEAITIDGDGNVYSTGGFYSDQDFDPGPEVYNLSSNGSQDIFISKLNNDASLAWTKVIGGGSYDGGTSIVVDNDNNVYTIGYFRKLFNGLVDFDPGPGEFFLEAGDLDLFILKLNGEGDFIWAKRAGGQHVTRRVNGEDVALDADGNLYITGTFNGPNIDFNPGPGIYHLSTFFSKENLFILKLDEQGDFTWVKAIGYGTSSNILWSKFNSSAIDLDVHNNVYVTGSFYDEADFDPGFGTHHLSASGYNTYILKLNENGVFHWGGSLLATSGDEEDDIGHAIALDTWGNIYTTGSFSKQTDFDPGVETHELTPNSVNAFLHKMRQQPCGIGPSITSENSTYTVCTGSPITLKATLPDDVTGFSYSWSSGPTADSIVVTPSVNTTYTVEVSYSPGCMASTSVDVNVVDELPVSVSGDTIVCMDEILLLEASGGDSYSWNNGATTSAISIIATESETYLVTVTDSNGCSGIDSVHVLVNSLPDLTIAGGTNIALCPDDAYTIQAEGVWNSYLWSTAETTSSIVVDNEGSYTVTVTGDNNCTTSETVTISNYPLIPTTYLQGAYCAGSSGFFFEGDGQSYSQGVHNITLTSILTNCDSLIELTVNELLESSTTISTSICAGEVYIINNVAYGIEGEYTEVIPNGAVNGCDSTINLNLSVLSVSENTLTETICAGETITIGSETYDSTGVYEQILTGSNGCDSIVTLVVSLILPPETPIAPSDLVVQQNAPPFELSVVEVPGATAYAWSVPPGVQILSGAGTNTILVDWADGPLTGGDICVSAINECGAGPPACMEVTVDLIDALSKSVTKGYSIFPNPTKDLIHVVFPVSVDGRLELRDYTGTLIQEMAIAQETVVDLSEFPEGVYLLLVKTDGGIWIERVVRL